MKIGENAPDFALKDASGKDWRLSEHAGETVVLLFYPGDDTPVCTKQMCAVRDKWADYRATGARIVGISTDSVESHESFAGKYAFPFPLLSDETGETIEKYEMKSWIPGRAARGVVVIDKTGRVAYRKVQPISLLRPNDEEILEAIRKTG